MAGMFGVGTPFTQTGPWGLSPFGMQGSGINPFALQQLYGQSYGNLSTGASLASPFGPQPLQQVAQLLQFLPQQLQQLESLQLHQLQQLQQLQQVTQILPQLLQQLIQYGSRSIQQPSQLQPFGQIPGLGGSLPWGTAQFSGSQPGPVM